MTASLLVVDDQPENFDVIETLLLHQDYEFYYVSSGKEALVALDKVCPDLILLDVMMPGMDGIQLCQEIKALPRWQAVPIIIVTALTDKEDMGRCLDSGADDFISKPVNGVELRARVNSLLRIKQQYDQLKVYAKLKEDTVRVLQNSLQALRGSLAMTLAHELKTPLTGILGGLDFLQAGFQSMTSEEIAEFLQLSRESAWRLEGLIQKLLNYTSLEFSPMQAAATEVVNADVIPWWVMAKAEQWGRLPDLTCEVPPVYLAVPSQHLQWIVEELIDNALKFSRTRTPVTLQGRVQGQWFCLRVCDRGHGMTPEQIEQIGAFIQFERNRMEQQGTGLGLAIAKRGVEIWGGQFNLTSTPAVGTTVDLSLPLKIR